MKYRLPVVAACGALLSAALPPSDFWPLLLALVPLFVYTAGSRSAREAFWLGSTFGLTFFALYVLWLPASFASPELFGGYFWLLYPPLLLILAAFWGLVTLAARLLGGGGAVTLALLPALWVLMEWARTQGYFAFPWGTLGYAWLGTPVAQVADTVGVWGLSLLTTTVASLLALPFRPTAAARNSRALVTGAAPVLLGVALIALTWWAGNAKLHLDIPGDTPEARRTALLIQGDLDPFGRLTGIEQEVEIQARLTSRAVESQDQPPDLIVWPEGAVMSGFAGRRGAQRLALVQDSSPQSVFLVGARAAEGSFSYNSAVTITQAKILDRYDKYYLVPFGERFPLAQSAAPLYRAVFGLFGLAPLESTRPGDGFEPLASPLGRLAAYICYESVFPQVQRGMVRSGAGVLVNITNDAWFSRGDGAQQHYQMGSMRAIETRRYLLRAGNDGITGVVDPYGRTLHQLPRGVADVMEAPFVMLEILTLYVRYGHLLLPLLLAWVAVALVSRLVIRQS